MKIVYHLPNAPSRSLPWLVPSRRWIILGALVLFWCAQTPSLPLAEAVSPKRLRIRLMLAQSVLKRGQASRCRRIAKRVLKQVKSHEDIVKLRIKPWAYYWLAASYATQKQKKRALKALRKAEKAGFWQAKTLRESPHFRHLRRNARFQQLLRRLKSSALEIRWLQNEAQVLPYELRQIRREELRRVDTNLTRYYQNRPSRIRPPSPAVYPWRRWLAAEQERHTLMLFPLQRKRIQRIRQFNRHTQLNQYKVSDYEVRARRKWRINQSMNLAGLRYRARKRAAKARSLEACRPTSKQSALKPLTFLKGKWNWSYRHAHNNNTLQGQIKWHRVGQCFFGVSSYKRKSKRLRILMHIYPTSAKTFALSNYEPHRVSFAKGSQLQSDKTLWEYSSFLRTMWTWTGKRLLAKAYSRNAADSFSLQSTTSWSRP